MSDGDRRIGDAKSVKELTKSHVEQVKEYKQGEQK